MQVVYQHCCGLDVHKETVAACVLQTSADGCVRHEVRTFSTMTASLQALSAWLHQECVERTAMESTGVYWCPVFNVLEEQVQEEIDRALAPFAATVALLRTIAGVGEIAAATIVAKIGADMSCFASAGHLASWAGLCPGHNQSAARRKSATTTKGNKWLRGVLDEVAWAAIKQHGTCVSAQFRRSARRQGKRKAVAAVAHRLLHVIYHVVRDQMPYRELGLTYLSPQDLQRQTRQHVRHLEHLGYTVTLTPSEAA